MNKRLLVEIDGDLEEQFLSMSYTLKVENGISDKLCIPLHEMQCQENYLFEILSSCGISSKGFSRPTSDTFVNIAAFAYMDLNDRKLAKEIFIQAIDESKNNPDEIDYIIESVEDEWGYNDKGLAQKLKKKYKK
jgi:hypothetical protein